MVDDIPEALNLIFLILVLSTTSGKRMWSLLGVIIVGLILCCLRTYTTVSFWTFMIDLIHFAQAISNKGSNQTCNRQIHAHRASRLYFLDARRTGYSCNKTGEETHKDHLNCSFLLEFSKDRTGEVEEKNSKCRVYEMYHMRIKVYTAEVSSTPFEWKILRQLSRFQYLLDETLSVPSFGATSALDKYSRSTLAVSTSITPVAWTYEGLCTILDCLCLSSPIRKVHQLSDTVRMIKTFTRWYFTHIDLRGARRSNQILLKLRSA